MESGLTTHQLLQELDQQRGSSHFNGRLRYEFLNTELFTTAPEALILADRWRWEYNSLRPHSALQVRTPLEAAQQGVAA